MWLITVEIKRWYYEQHWRGRTYYLIKLSTDSDWLGMWFSKDSDMHGIHYRSRNEGRNDVMTYSEHKAYTQ